MKQNQKGFSVVEILIVIVVVGLIGTVGWLVYDRQNSTKKADTTPTTSTTSTTKKETLKTETKQTTAYYFKELGISMDIAQGWEVKANPTKEEGVNFYSWTVSKSGGDGKIVLSSTGFRGGFEECMLTPASIKEVKATNNPKLLFMSWSYVYDNKTTYSVRIVTADEAVFKTANNETATSIKNSATKAGNYYLCLGYPTPGFSLGLNSEAAPGFSRKDSISALESSGNKFMSPTAQSYADVKAMLTSVK